tara:strand:+ start:206 stop:508 length:303 start_codon:yes stop_codon:yes gene_type:complete
MNRQELVKQIVRLEAYIEHGTVRDKDLGLCCNVLTHNFPIRVFKTWAGYSGSLAYPLEGGSWAYCGSRIKHDRSTKYGKLRLSLAKHCLEWSIKELKETV